MSSSSNSDRPPSYPGTTEASASRPSIEATLDDHIACDHPFGMDESILLNGSLASLSGGICANYLLRQQQQQRSSFGMGHIFRLPDDLKVAKKSLVSTMSEIYAMTLIVLCCAFTSTEIITDNLPMDYFEAWGFYTYLYSGSVGFMLYLFCYVLRVKSVVRASGEEQTTRQEAENGFDVQDFIQRMTLATGLDVKQTEKCRFSISHPSDTNADRMVYVKLMTSENEKNHGSLILRIGAIFFGLGTLIYTGLEFLLFFEIPQTCISWKILLGINPVLYMVFVFMQMYYIFMHSRININKNKILAKFGMMHIIATNSCLVIRTLVKESAKEMEHSSALQLSNNSLEDHDHDAGAQTHESVDHLACCQRIHIIGETIENSSIYLYPFIIEYSIIGISVVYSMWRHIGDNPRYVQLDEVRSSSSSNNAIKRPLASGNTVRHPLDWSSSSCGLFTGLLSLVALIINLIVYFALVNQDDYKSVAIWVNHGTDTLINALMIIAMFIGFFQIKHLDFIMVKDSIDSTMMLTSFGMLTYSIFTIIAGVLHSDNFGALIVTNGIFELEKSQNSQKS